MTEQAIGDLVEALRAPSGQEDSAWHEPKATYATKPRALLDKIAAALETLAADLDEVRQSEAELELACRDLDLTIEELAAENLRLAGERDAAIEGQVRWIHRVSLIREASGVHAKPMLEDLPSAIKAKIDAAEARALATEQRLAEIEAGVTREKVARIIDGAMLRAVNMTPGDGNAWTFTVDKVADDLLALISRPAPTEGKQ